jgi:hypothetical protein
MFLKSHVELAVDFDAVRAALLRRPEAWLDGLVEAADRDRVQLLMACRLDAGVGGDAQLDVGAPISTDRLASVPLRLHAAGPHWIVSAEGSLDAAWLGPGCTYLALQAQYSTTEARACSAADRALLHRVAETVALRFLQAIAARLEAGQPRGTSTASSPASASKCRTNP